MLNHETEKIEYKKSTGELKEAVISVCAILNKHSEGDLYFGVKNDGTVIGQQIGENSLRDVSQAITRQIKPTVYPCIEEQIIDGKTVIHVSFSGNNPPYTAYGIPRIRVADEDLVMEQVDYERELKDRTRTDYYDERLSPYMFDDVSFIQLRSIYKSQTGNSFEDTDYKSWGIINDAGALTNAGALLADYSPVKQSRVFCTRWNGLTKASGGIDALDNAEFQGSLVQLLLDSIKFIGSNSKRSWMKTPDGRINLPDYPERAVQEGVVNALIHRDYTNKGSEIHIDIYDDRLEIYSPGGMADGSLVQNDDIRNIPSVRRNPALADIFNRLNFMERRGSGFKKIIEDYKFQKKYLDEKQPEFRSTETAFFLVLPNLNYFNERDDGEGPKEGPEERPEKKERTNETLTDRLKKGQKEGPKEGPKEEMESQNVRDNAILDLIKNDASISRSRMANELGLSEKQVRISLERLRNDGVIRRVGSRKEGVWIITSR